MGFKLGGFGDKLQGMVESVKGGNVGELLQHLPLDQLPLDQLLEKLPLDQLPLDQLMEKLPLDQLLNSSFLQKFTDFASINEMLSNWGIGGHSAEALQSLPAAELNEHVQQTTSFGSFKEMLLKAAEHVKQGK